MICKYVNEAEYYGVPEFRLYSKDVLITELEDSDTEEVREKIIEMLDPIYEDYNLDDEIEIPMHCDTVGSDIDVEVRIGDYFTKEEWNQLIEKVKQKE